MEFVKCIKLEKIKFETLIEMFDNEQLSEVGELYNEHKDFEMFVPLIEDTDDNNEEQLPTRFEQVVLLQNIHGRLYTDLTVVRRNEKNDECYVDICKLG